MTPNEEMDGPDLIRGKLIGKGGFGKVYDGLFRGGPVAIKEAHRNPPEAVDSVILEGKFLLEPQAQQIEVSNIFFDEIGIPLRTHQLNVRLIRAIPQANSSRLNTNGIIVLEKAPEGRISDDDVVNKNLPLPFHFVIVAGYAKLLSKIQRILHVTLDSQPTDLTYEFIRQQNRTTLQVVKVDCRPKENFRDKVSDDLQTPEALAVGQLAEHMLIIAHAFRTSHQEVYRDVVETLDQARDGNGMTVDEFENRLITTARKMHIEDEELRALREIKS